MLHHKYNVLHHCLLYQLQHLPQTYGGPDTKSSTSVKVESPKGTSHIRRRVRKVLWICEWEEVWNILNLVKPGWDPDVLHEN